MKYLYIDSLVINKSWVVDQVTPQPIKNFKTIIATVESKRDGFPLSYLYRNSIRGGLDPGG
jgi:hypothetical protein